MIVDTLTPNAKLTKIAADRRNWTATMNRNMMVIDALIASYFVVQNLQGVWQNSTAYTMGQTVVDDDTATVWQCQVSHTSASTPTTFAEDRAAHSTYWTVYSSPARARGAWTSGTSYALNDFVVSGSQYAICIVTHVSSGSFATDLAAGKWSVLVDLSAAGSQVLPVPSGAADANKITVTNASGSGYTIINADALLTILDATTVGKALLQAASATDARTAIGAQVAGSYQPLASSLSTLAAFTIGAFADELLACVDAAGVRTAIGLGSAALLASSAVLQVANNLSDLNNAATARTNIGLAYASQTEQETGTATDRVVAPGTQKNHPSAAKGWGSFDSGGNILASYNVLSIVDAGTGLVTVNWDVDFSSAAYTAVASINAGGGYGQHSAIANKAAGSIQILAGNTVTQGAQDALSYEIAAFGDQ